MEAELFIGRQREIDALSAALDRACAVKAAWRCCPASLALEKPEPRPNLWQASGPVADVPPGVAAMKKRGRHRTGPGCKSLARCAWTVTAANFGRTWVRCP